MSRLRAFKGTVPASRWVGLEGGEHRGHADDGHRALEVEAEDGEAELGRRLYQTAHQEPGAITMQAVANVLGVDRSAINNHVANKEALLMDVALDVFAEAFAAVRIDAPRSWQDVCRQYARGFADSVIA